MLTMTIEEWLNNDELGINIWKNKYRYNNETLDEWFERVSGHNEDIKDLIINKKFLFGGRTLANRGTKNGSFSNCYCSGRVEDSLDNIMDVAKKIAITFKAQGGQGLSLTNIRPKGFKVGEKFESEGIIPFMEIYNTVTASISQGGARKGALMMSLDAEHPQIKDFITIKSDHNKINNANLSVEVNDRFMEAVKKYYDEGTVVKYTVPNTFKGGNKDGYEVTPIEIYKLMMEHVWKDAEPGVMFMNRFSNYNLMEFIPEYQIYTSNPCGEQPLPKNFSCNLSSFNLSEYVNNPFTDKASFDFSSFTVDIYKVVKAMDDIIDENAYNHPLKEQTEKVLKYRNLGIGVMGLADALIKLGIRYGSPMAIDITNSIFNCLFCNAILASNQLAKERGVFPGYNKKVFNSSIIEEHFSEEEIEELKKDGIRNCSLISVAPTGSIATMLSVSGGCEPHFRLTYKRRTKSLHKEEKIYDVHVKVVQEAKDKNIDIHSNYFIESQQIPWKERVQMQAAMQKHTDTAISSTCNLPKETSLEEIERIYLYAWECGLKGFTCFRDGCRESILITNDTPKSETKNYEKRPVSLPAKLVRFKNGSENWIAFIGMKNNEPYEIFTGKYDLEEFPVPRNIDHGEIIKVKDNLGKRYDFKYIDQYGYENCLGGLSRIFNREYWNYAKLFSALLRSNTPLVFILKTINSMSFETDTLNTWKNGVLRALKCFVEDGTESYEKCPECGEKLVFQGGCAQCLTCGFSKCG